MKQLTKLTALLLVVLLTLPLYACGAPELETVKDEFVALIDASHKINTVFFGEGLPTFRRGSEEAEQYRIYDDLAESYGFYEVVIIDEEFYDVASIQAAAELVYTADYLEGVYTMAFDGVADSDTGEITTARYLDTESYLLRYAYGEKDSFDFLEGRERQYLYDTMKIVRGRAKSVIVSIDSYVEGEDEILNVRLRFVLQDGVWRLDTPTY